MKNPPTPSKKMGAWLSHFPRGQFYLTKLWTFFKDIVSSILEILLPIALLGVYYLGHKTGHFWLK